MDTEPVPSVLDRNRYAEHPEANEVLNFLADSVAEVVNMGTHVHQWLQREASKYSLIYDPPLLLLRHYLEMIDACSILLREGASRPMKANLRGALEAYLQLEYLMSEEGNLERRSRDYIACHLRRQLKRLRKMDPDTQLGKQFRSKLGEGVLENSSLGEIGDLEARRERIKDRLSTEYGDSDRAYKEHREKRGSGTVKWYQLRNGPRSLVELSQAVDEERIYVVFYQSFSGSVHGSSIFQEFFQEDGEDLYLNPLRTPRGATTLTSIVMTLSCRTYRHIIECFVPGKMPKLESWYEDYVMKQVRKIQNVELDFSSDEDS
ncbi:MAG: DUF5677 domain-containing protein [Salinibacter sp.]|uniref:DUF5677 domain-containing protein n=1 Tax=Salinibacter sp. TaxID=2065818 RepID=UPI0035D4BE7B